MTTVRTMTLRQAGLVKISRKLSRFQLWTTFVVKTSTDQNADTNSTARAAMYSSRNHPIGGMSSATPRSHGNRQNGADSRRRALATEGPPDGEATTSPVARR